MGRNELVVIDGELKAETDKAWLISDGDTQEWFPKSKCECLEYEPEVGRVYEFEVPEWLSELKGFI